MAQARLHVGLWARLQVPRAVSDKLGLFGSQVIEQGMDCVCLFVPFKQSSSRAKWSMCLVLCMLSLGCCAAQLGDRPRLDANLGNFESFNEPFYGSYIKEDFGAACCLLAGRLELCARSSTVCVSRYACFVCAGTRELD